MMIRCVNDLRCALNECEAMKESAPGSNFACEQFRKILNDNEVVHEQNE